MVKKCRNLFALLALMLFIFCGCSRIHTPEETSPATRMVVQVDVTCTRDGESFDRSYTAPEKLEAMLLYLRLLKPQGRANTDPEELSGTASKITVHLFNGQQRIYRLRADRFLSKDAQPWQTVDETHAQDLYPLILLMDSDPT